MLDERTKCLKCRHYYITWDTKFPKGCKLFGFKTSQMPSVAVYSTDGEPCKGFEEKKRRAKQD